MSDRGGLFRRFPSPPIAVQVMALLLAGLVVAQAVTLGLTLLLPPAPAMHHSLADIAADLRGSALDSNSDRPLVRTVETQPPSFQSPGWVASETASVELARLLNVPPEDVRLLFYAPPPFAGAETRRSGHTPLALMLFTTYAQAQTLPPPAPGGRPGPMPPMRRPGAGGMRPGLPPSDFARAAQAGNPPGFAAMRPARPGGQRPFGPGAVGSPDGAGRNFGRPAGFPPGGNRAGRGVDPLFTAPFRSSTVILPAALRGEIQAAPPLDPVADAAARQPAARASPEPEARMHAAPAIEPAQVTAPAVAAPPPIRAAPPRQPPVAGRPLPAPVARSLFGLAPPPFVEGDFVAALRVGNDRWVTLRPQPEAFPNSWQRRVLMWFALSLAVVAPLGWIFARRLAAPLAGFAAAAERLGRDPASPVIVADGPAEIGRAARAFNAMQGRLSRYITDRTAMIGAISHDLRTPLARLRFRLERASPSLRREMGQDLDQMEAMITSVLAFMREDAEAGARQRIDLRSLVECVIDEAEVTGAEVALEPGEPAVVEVSVLGLQRVFANLVDNAVKYGDSARVTLKVEGDEAVVEIRDKGPGLEASELERVFTPFYRGVEARTSSKQGVGLGLSSARSIVRAHGGDIRLALPGRGLLVQVRLPLVGGVEISPHGLLRAAE